MSTNDLRQGPSSRDCAWFRQLTLDQQYDEIDAREAEALRLHLAGCRDCSAQRAEWGRVLQLLALPEVHLALSGSSGRRSGEAALGAESGFGSGAPASAIVPAILGGMTAFLSLCPALFHPGQTRLPSTMLGVAALVWTLAYQALFAAMLAEHRSLRKPLPIDVRTVLHGLLACESVLMLAAAVVLWKPFLGWHLETTMRLKLPELLTSLSGSIVLAIGAAIALLGLPRALPNALAIAVLHGLLLLPGEMLIDGFPGQPAAWLAAITFLAACAVAGTALGGIGPFVERARAGSAEPWHTEAA